MILCGDSRQLQYELQKILVKNYRSARLERSLPFLFHCTFYSSKQTAHIIIHQLFAQDLCLHFTAVPPRLKIIIFMQHDLKVHPTLSLIYLH